MSCKVEELLPYIKRFEAFVCRYRNRVPEKEAQNIDLKREHSMRVLENAKLIVGSKPLMELDNRLRRLCFLAALFHDIGRFPQYERFRTFSDNKSVNHGTLGASTLFKEQVFSNLPAEDRRILYSATAMHNRRFVPQRLPEDLRLVLTVTRDADKLDILSVMIAHFQPQNAKNDVVTLHLIDDPTAFTPAICDNLFEGRLANYVNMVYINDFKLLLLSWIHDIVHPESLRLLRERGHIEDIIKTLPPGQAMEHVGNFMRELLGAEAS